MSSLVNHTGNNIHLTIEWSAPFDCQIEDHTSFYDMLIESPVENLTLEKCLENFTKSQEIERTCEE